MIQGDPCAHIGTGTHRLKSIVMSGFPAITWFYNYPLDVVHFIFVFNDKEIFLYLIHKQEMKFKGYSSCTNGFPPIPITLPLCSFL